MPTDSTPEWITDRDKFSKALKEFSATINEALAPAITQMIALGDALGKAGFTPPLELSNEPTIFDEIGQFNDIE